MRVTIHLARRLARDLFIAWALLQTALLFVLGAFLLLRWPLLGRIPAAEATSFLFLEIGPTSLALALPAALALFFQRMRQRGELRALVLLPGHPIRTRMGMVLALLPFLLIFFFWAHELAPRNRARLEERLGSPLLLLAGGRYEELDRAASRLGGLALSYDGVEGRSLTGVTLQQRRGQDWTVVSARRLGVRPPAHLVLEDGRVWTSGSSPIRRVGFERLELDLLGSWLPPAWDPGPLRNRAWLLATSLLLGLALVWASIGGRTAPGPWRRTLAWVLPPFLFLLAASA